ncbi:hypothetical protein, partial [Ruthenibacterium lactatiformans]|uniref:hypothetical protein n=1 Tax=Ruthenibacterium lactatiformans TaxID=1550024 RepID=UPI0039A39203
GCGFVEAALRRHGIITLNPPLSWLGVCAARAPVPARMGLKILNRANCAERSFYYSRLSAAS